MKKLGFSNQPRPLIDGQRTRVWLRRPDNMREAEIPRLCVRYVVGTTSQGLPRVAVRSGAEGNTATTGHPLPAA
jgi:hypothetical protein